MNKCKKTIDTLITDLCPTTRVVPPKIQFLIWILSLGVTILGILTLHPIRSDIGVVLRDPFFLAEAILLHGAFFLGSYHLFSNAVPGLQKVRIFPRLAMACLGMWVGLLIFRGSVAPAKLMGACHNAWVCVGQTIILNVIASLLLIVFLRRYQISVLSYVMPGILLSTSFGVAVLEWVCESMNPLHLLIAHGGPMLGMMLLMYGVMWVRNRAF